MLQEIFDIVNYQKLNPNTGWDAKLLAVFKVYGIMVVAIIAFGPLWLLADKMITNVFHHQSFNMHYREVFQRMFKKAGVPAALVFICIIGPVFEEVIFRLPLSFKKRDAAIAAFIAIFYLSGAFFHPAVLWVKIAVEVGVALLITLISFKFIANQSFKISPKRRQQIIALSICLFGLMHISNYKPLDWPLLWLYPLFVIPQLLIGWGITYLRFKNGFAWGVALHILVNTVSTLLGLLAKG